MVDIVNDEKYRIHYEKLGHISEISFCEKYNITKDQFTRWIMNTPFKNNGWF